jgi:amino acid adenylation domain-containing protein
MDPSQPLGRLQTIVEQVDARVILTSSLHQELGKQMCDGATVVMVNEAFFVGHGDLGEGFTFPHTRSEAPMYVQFTSGSTGKPKGVVISFASYSSGAIPRAAKVGYHPGSRCLDFPSYAFDVSIDCILCTLSTGGCVCVPSEDDRLNNLGGAITTLQANMVHVTPSVARLLDPKVIKSIEVLGLGGEYVSPGDIEAWSSTCKLAIAYGPSECTVGCTINDTVSTSCTGIGKGVGGVTWIVDPDNDSQLLPVGDVGELLIEGPIVGDGYLSQPEKTAELFIEDPIWLTSGHSSYPGRSGRLYKTGDLVRYDPESGVINFVGRKDQQVKLRGQRVELGEVEYGLKSSLPSSMTAVADVIKFGGKGEATLVAFLADADGPRTRTNQDVDIQPLSPQIQKVIQETEQYMAQTLPRFMIPSAWILVGSLPMLVSGKIDRKKLREVGSGMTLRQIQQLKSRSKQITSVESLEAENKLRQAWKQVLSNGVEISRDDSFFHVGGDSLRAMHLVAAARGVGLSLTVADIFSRPVLTDMALAAKPFEQNEVSEIPAFSLLGPLKVEDVRSAAAKQCDISSDAIEDLYPCTPLQEGIMALSAKVSDAYVAQRVVHVADRSVAIALFRAFQTAADDASIMRTRIAQVPGAGLLQVVINPQWTSQYRTHTSLEAYLELDQKDSMGLGTDLVRYAVISNHDTEGAQFVLTIHHALYDGWSMPLIVERANQAYREQALAKAAPFKSFIKFLAQIDRQACDRFWTEHLDGELQLQFPNLPYRNYQTRADSLLERYVPFSQNTTGHTIATLVRATWALVAATQIASDDVVFGETLTGRNAAIVGAEQIEGPMITTVPFRVRINRALSSSQYLQLVHNEAIKRIPYEHAGLQNIRRLSSYAREACELRTGLVLHPKVDDGAESKSTSGPADGFIPANEAEAAREALNFNTYALMLVVTVDSNGFLIMASFDSNCVSAGTMNHVLEDFEVVFSHISSSTEVKLSDIRSTVVTRSGLITPPRTDYGDAGLSKTVLHPQRKDVTYTPKSMSATSSVATSPVDGPNPKLHILLRIWSRILGVPESDIQPDSEFFDFGDSISAMKVVAEARMENLQLSVAQIFNHRQLDDIANVATWIEEKTARAQPSATKFKRFSALDEDMTAALVSEGIASHLADPNWKVDDVYPARPLQAIAVDGTVKLPRYSVRYEVVYFNHHLNLGRLQKSSQALVDANEILRTVFIKHGGRTLGVVLNNLVVSCDVHDIDGDLKDYVRNFCNVDVMRKHSLGSPFVALHYVRCSDHQSALLFKISHAQYDEICLPNMLHQLSALYEDKPAEPQGAPFSSFVKHVLQNNMAQSIPYWKKLLDRSQMTQVKPNIPLHSRKAISIFKTFDISARSRSTTVATLPTAAWALCLANTLCLDDVVFGEVVSGRNVDLPGCGSINGPCWQYIPVRVQLRKGMTFYELLQGVQDQHIASSCFEGIGLDEIRTNCTEWPDSVDWFGSVVHQDVEHVTELPFESASSEMETIYPHLENLREVKCQCFLSGQSMTIEIVTYESWRIFGQTLLENFTQALTGLISTPHSPLSN